MRNFLRCLTPGKRLLVITLMLMLSVPNVLFGQRSFDSFTDGDFSANPVWGGNTTEWAIVTSSDAAAGATNSNTLRLSASGSGTKYLSSQVATWNNGQEWSFWIGRRSQPFTLSNQQYFWLYANEANLTSATVDGYRLSIGDDTGNDEIRLEYILNGVVSTTVITSSASVANGIEDVGFLVRVTRNGNGVWTLFTSTLPSANGTGSIATANTSALNVNNNVGSATNNTLVPAANGYIGVAALHSTSSNARTTAEFDQIQFSALGANINGTIAAGEYGTHTNGQNQETNGATWFMNWDDDYLYMAFSNLDNSGNGNNRRILCYIDKDPATPVNSANNTDGTIAGFPYSNSNLGTLPFRADCFFSIETGYRQLNIANGSNGWGANNTSYGIISLGGSNNIIEIAIPWSVVTNGSSRPAAFNWTGYVTDGNAGGNYFYQMPTQNTSGLAGTSIPTGSTAGFERYYTVSTTTVGSSTPPFSRNSYVFNRLVDATGFGAISIYDFTMNSSGRTITRGTGAWVIGGDMRINAGTVNFGSTADGCNVTGSLFNTGTLTLSTAIGGDITVQGNITDNGTFNANNRAVFFTGSNVQTIQGSGTFDIAYVRINKAAGRVVLGTDLTCQGPNGGNAIELSGTSSILDLNGFTLNLGQTGVASTYNNAVSPAGFIRSSPASSISILGNGALGTLLFDQSTPGTSNSIRNLTINRASTGSVTLGNDLNITGGLSANTEGALTVTNGVFNTGGFLTLKSSALGTARLGQGNTIGGYINGDVTVERFIPQNASKGWRLLASNTTGQSINASWQEGQANSLSNLAAGFGTQISAGNTLGYNLSTAQSNGFDTLSAGVSLFRYNPTTDGLLPITNTLSTSLASQPGYFLFIRGDRRVGGYGAGLPTAPTVLRSKGSVFQGNQPAVTTGDSGYALMRNPYPSRIDMRQIVRTGALVNGYQVWDPKLGGAFGVGAYQTFTFDGTNYLVTPGNGSYGSNGSTQNFIESGSAFFIQSVGGGTGSAQVVEACKASGSSVVNRPATPQAGTGRLTFNLYANNAGNYDPVDGGLVFFDDQFSNAVDVNDVRKNFNFNENFALIRDNVQLVVEKRRQANVNDTLFFNMSQLRQITYRLDIQAMNIDPLINTAVLEDRYTSTSTTLDLTNTNAYTFTVNATAASRAADRFKIVFRQSGVVPVTFISVKAAQAGNNIALEWKVANEVNTIRYEIEKSTDGTRFTAKGSVAATGASTYNWLDENVVSGYNYYRVKSVDQNGQVRYTQVVKVQLGGKAGITISPNPVQGNYVNVLINQQLTGKYAIRLTNIAGQAVYNKEVTHNGGSASQSFTLPSSLSDGVYQLEVVAPDNSRHVEKLIIQGN